MSSELPLSSPAQSGERNASNSSSSSTSRKRKRADVTLEEIEVNIEAPEPPSKKALRKAKKQKLKPSVQKPIVDNEISGAEPKTEPKAAPNGTSARKSKEETTTTDSSAVKRSEYGIWIGNLPWSATTARLREFLIESSGIEDKTITRIHMPLPTDSRSAATRPAVKAQNKGFAYVDFSTQQAQIAAIALSETLFTGRRVLIKPSTSFEGRPEKSEPDSTSRTLSENPPSNRIFIGNLPFDTTHEELYDHFRRCGEVADAFIATFEDSDKCKGYGWITFEDITASEAAVRGFAFLEPEADPQKGDAVENVQDVHPERKRELKKRKWFVKLFKGRELRREFAEGKDVRYKKRFRKDMSKGEEGDIPAADAIVEVEVAEPRSSGEARKSTFNHRKSSGKNHTVRLEERQGAPRRDAVAIEQYLTGAAVKGQGKKITFD